MSHVNVSKTTRHVKPIKSFTTTAGRFVAILALAILFISTLLSASSASSFRSRRNSSSQANSASESKSGVTGKTAVSEHNSSTRNAKELLKGSGGGAASLFSALMPQPVPLSLDSIATYDTDCATPKSSFNLGDTVCVQVSGGPSLTIIPRRIALIDSAGNVRNVIPITSDPQTSTFTLPSTPTTANGSDIYDNRGDWKINVVPGSRFSVRTSTLFTVSDPQNVAANLVIYNSNNTDGLATSGSTITFVLWLTNQGPDAASNVTVTDSATNASFVSKSQDSGTAFDCSTTSGTTTCTIASLPSGASARFTFVYQAGSGGSVANTASISSDTADLNSADNSATSNVDIASGGGGTTCTVTCPDDVNQIANTTDSNGNPGAIVHFPTPSGNDDCGAINVDHCNDCFFPVGTTTVKATAATGDSCSFNVIVTSNADAPQISCPPNKTANAGSDCTAIVDIGTATATGKNVTITGTRSDGLPLTDPYPGGTTIVTWVATAHSDTPPTDANAIGTDTCTQTVVVSDVTAPTIVVSPQTASADASCQAAVPDFTASATIADNCADRSSITVTQNPAPGTMVGLGSTTVTLSATDQANNTSSVNTTFTVNDTTPPTVTAPADVTAYTGAGATSCDTVVSDATLGSATASDNCGTATITRSGVPAGNVFPKGTTTITYTATDAAGNPATATQTVTVIDNTPPTITAPAHVTAYTGAGATSCGTVVSDATLGAASASDNCSGISAITRSGVPSGNNFPVGTTTVTYSVTDAHGNSSQAQQTVTVIDNTPPSISCPTPITVYLPLHTTATSMVVNYQTPVGTDNCPGAVTTQTAGLASGATFPVGTTTNTFKVTDAAGNTTSCSFTVTVLYDFSGFFSPVSNLPTLNVVKAGSAVPVKFSLSGNKGLGIFVADSPQSGVIPCDASAPVQDLTDTVTAGGSSLSYDASSDQYVYTWKTDSSWTGCRQLVVTLNDGTQHVANFKFK